MTHSPGDSFITQRCENCGAREAEYCRPFDAYFCDDCYMDIVEGEQSNDDEND